MPEYLGIPVAPVNMLHYRVTFIFFPGVASIIAEGHALTEILVPGVESYDRRIDSGLQARTVIYIDYGRS